MMSTMRKFLLHEGIASIRSLDHPAVLLVLDAHWHRAFRLLIAEHSAVMFANSALFRDDSSRSTAGSFRATEIDSIR